MRKIVHIIFIVLVSINLQALQMPTDSTTERIRFVNLDCNTEYRVNSIYFPEEGTFLSFSCVQSPEPKWFSSASFFENDLLNLYFCGIPTPYSIFPDDYWQYNSVSFSMIGPNINGDPVFYLYVDWVPYFTVRGSWHDSHYGSDLPTNGSSTKIVNDDDVLTFRTTSEYTGTDFIWFIQPENGPVFSLTLTGKQIEFMQADLKNLISGGIDPAVYNTYFGRGKKWNIWAKGPENPCPHHSCYDYFEWVNRGSSANFVGWMQFAEYPLRLRNAENEIIPQTKDICTDNISLEAVGWEGGALTWEITQVIDGIDTLLYTWNPTLYPTYINISDLEKYKKSLFIQIRAKRNAFDYICQFHYYYWIGQTSDLNTYPTNCCPNQSNGSVSITRTNPDGLMTMSLYKNNVLLKTYEDIEETVIVPGLNEGSYEIRYYYNTSTKGACTKYHYFKIDDFAVPSISIIDSLSPSCGGLADGSLTIIPDNLAFYKIIGTNKYSIDPKKLISGSYTIIAEDNNHCESNKVKVSVPEAFPLKFSLDSSRQPLCFGEENGKLIVSNMQGGPTGSVSINYYVDSINTLVDPACSSNGLFCLGQNYSGTDTYDVYISKTRTGAGACVSQETLHKVIGEPEKLLLTAVKSYVGNDSIYNIDCHGENNGYINVSAYNTQGTTQYFIDPPSGTLIGESFRDLPADDYQIWVEDHTADAICYSDTFPVTLTEPGPIVLTDTTIVPETCPGTGDAAISVTAHSPVSGCSYVWSYQSNTSGSLDNIPSGTYQLTVADDICPGKTFVFLIGSIPLVNADYETSMPLCRNSSDGNITITGIRNNTGPDTWYSFGNNHNILLNSLPLDLGSLSSGTHPFAVYDSRYIQTSFEGCKTILDIKVDQKNAVQIMPKFTFPHCYGGTGSITLSKVTGPGDTARYSYTWYNAEGLEIAHSKNLINVPGGSYTLSVFDEDDCESVFEDLLLYQPPAVQIKSVDVTDASCAEVHNGSLSINAEGGTGDLRYSIGNDSYSFGSLFTGLAPGNYSVSVTDAYGCFAEKQVELGAGELLLDIAGIKPVTCFGDHDGYMYLSASGGNGICNYFVSSLDTLLTNNYGIFNRLGTGLYLLSAADPATGCLSDTLTAVITEPDSITIGITLVDPASCGQYNGQVSHSVSGGNSGYTVRWERELLGIVTDLSALHSGNYIVKVTDSKNCRSSQNFYLPERSAPVITGYEIPDSTWCGLPLGKVTVHVEDGSPAYQYHWSHNASLNSPLAANLVSGDYSLTVTDQYQCRAELDFTLDDGPALVMQSASVNATCNTGDGSATLIVSGGKAPYVYQWPVEVSSVPVSNPLMTGLTAGIYEVFITDAIGCVDSIDVTVSDNSSPNITINQLTSAWCDLPTGTMTATTTGGGSPLYYYLRQKGDQTILSNSLSATNLLQGKYILQVMTAAECSKYKEFIIGDSLRPQLSLLTTDSSSCGQPTGSITTSLNQGLAPFIYAWSTGFSDNTGSLTNIPSGKYSVTLTDSRGCIDSLVTEVFDKNAPLLQILGSEDAYCGNPTGSFLLKAMQGIIPYLGYLEQKPEKTYSFVYTDSLHAYASLIDSLLPSADLYSMWTEDAQGCESNTILYYIDDFNPLQLNIIDIDPVRCHGSSDGKALVLAEQGAEPYHYAWSSNPVDSALNTGLPGGPFGVTATDAAGCSRSENFFSIPEPLAIRLTNSNAVNPLCHNSCNGSIYITAAGGTGPLVFIWNQQDTASAGTNLCSGNNILEITDANGCQMQSLFTLGNPPVLSAPSLPQSLTICTGQEYAVDPGDEWQGYSWTSDNGFSSQERIIRISQPGNYYLEATSGVGCAVLDTFSLMVSESLLNAEFLMAGEANAGDTIVIIEISWPPAEQYSWSFPDGSVMCLDNDYHKEIVFDTPGSYYIELTASLATCVSVKGKYIEILETSPGKSAEEFKPYGRLIRSFEIYPNPAGDDLTIRIRLSEKSDLRVDVLSIDGRLVDNSLVASGLNEYTLSLDVSQLMPGMYLVRVVTRSQTETKMLIVR